MRYRKEIDGLRAVAVLPVMLFHAGFSLFSGGFVGVDIFFVISGYLITMILIEQIETDNFSIVDFYERRARRILPALFVVMMSCIPFAWMWMASDQWIDFSQSLVAASLFASNVLFWSETGYFDTASEEKPLLHTWSLAIEEQYYLFFPIFLFLAWKLGRKAVVGSIVVFALASLGLSEWGWRNSPALNFFLTPSRLWELFAGSIASVVIHRYGVIRNQWFSLVGLAMIVSAIFLYDADIPFPSVYTLLPVIGTALVILFTDGNTYTSKLLGLRPVVFVGLISYSAYLWHQPLLAFGRIRLSGHLPLSISAGLIALSLVLAFLSLKFIETPIRKKVWLVGRESIFGASAAMLCIPILIGLSGYLGYFSPRISLDLDSRYAGDGFNWIENLDQLDSDFVLFGDSHAKQYFGELSAQFGKGTMIAQSACLSLPKLVNVYKEESKEREDCISTLDKLLQYLSKSNVKYILIAQRWNKELYDLETDRVFGLRTESGLSLLLTRLDDLVASIPSDKKIVLIGNVPAAYVGGEKLRNGYIKCLAVAEAENCPTVYNKELREGKVVNSLLSEHARKYDNVSFFDPAEALCDDDSCFILKDNNLLYSDHAHLTRRGVRLVVDGLSSFLKR